MRPVTTGLARDKHPSDAQVRKRLGKKEHVSLASQLRRIRSYYSSAIVFHYQYVRIEPIPILILPDPLKRESERTGAGGVCQIEVIVSVALGSPSHGCRKCCLIHVYNPLHRSRKVRNAKNITAKHIRRGTWLRIRNYVPCDYVVVR